MSADAQAMVNIFVAVLRESPPPRVLGVGPGIVFLEGLPDVFQVLLLAAPFVIFIQPRWWGAASKAERRQALAHLVSTHMEGGSVESPAWGRGRLPPDAPTSLQAQLAAVPVTYWEELIEREAA